ncbi:hypothetical protein CEXT_102731 [Caerostris extrusa]|uniref:Uncharacterized protein n=1 Tax=Caerostris extrusa TaxID=172846 RepID=A0AAV4M9Q0_CAEEX|nr:hypothetical protein CEXT_102731 [Caerostris extrusa]
MTSLFKASSSLLSPIAPLVTAMNSKTDAQNEPIINIKTIVGWFNVWPSAMALNIRKNAPMLDTTKDSVFLEKAASTISTQSTTRLKFSKYFCIEIELTLLLPINFSSDLRYLRTPSLKVV